MKNKVMKFCEDWYDDEEIDIEKEDRIVTNSTFSFSEARFSGNYKNNLYVLNSVLNNGFSFSNFSEIIIKDSVVHIPPSAALSNSRRLLFENCIVYKNFLLSKTIFFRK